MMKISTSVVPALGNVHDIGGGEKSRKTIEEMDRKYKARHRYKKHMPII